MAFDGGGNGDLAVSTVAQKVEVDGDVVRVVNSCSCFVKFRFNGVVRRRFVDREL